LRGDIVRDPVQETNDPQYLALADRITDWFARRMWPEQRMNWLHHNVNTYHCFIGPIVRALMHRFVADFGIDPDCADGKPSPSAFLTILCDGRCRFTSGPPGARGDTGRED
jgi:hypothetical protein